MAVWITVGLLVVLIALLVLAFARIRRVDRRIKETRDDLRERIDVGRDQVIRRMAPGKGARGKLAPPATVVKDWDPHVETAAPRETVTFGICLAGALSVKDWKHTCGLLSDTLRSVLRQGDPRLRVVICGHDTPAIPEIEDERVAFLRLEYPPPMDSRGYRGDKARKRLNLGRKLREAGGGYYMQLDADDLVDRDLVATVLDRRHPHGFILGDGYVLDWSAGLVAPSRKVWPFGLDRVCGSTSVVYLGVDDLPGPEDNPENPDLLFNMLRQHLYVKATLWEMGRGLQNYDGRAVTYVVNHEQNLSFQMQKAGQRGRTIVDRIARHAITDPDDLAEFDRRFGTQLSEQAIEAAAQ